MKNSLYAAKVAKNDEFYTSYEDVAKELIHWKHRLKNKNIICPADGPESAFVKFLTDVKDEWEIKSITYSCWPVDMFDIDYSQYDVCITNPPFSKYNEVLETLYNSSIDFILLAPWNILWRRKYIELWNNHQVFLGFGTSVHPKWTNCDGKICCNWITTFDDYNISKRQYNCEDWTEFGISQCRYISSYDYEYKIKPSTLHILLKKRQK